MTGAAPGDGPDRPPTCRGCSTPLIGRTGGNAVWCGKKCQNRNRLPGWSTGGNQLPVPRMWVACVVCTAQFKRAGNASTLTCGSTCRARLKAFGDRCAKYGIGRLDYDRILAEQNGACAVCLWVPQDRWSLDIDHCHQTGAVRGLLCNRCNVGIGALQDSPDNLLRAAAYLTQLKDEEARRGQ